MFESIKANIRLIALGVLITVSLGAFGSYIYRGHELEKLTVQSAQQASAINDLTHVVDTSVKSAVVTEQIQTVVAKTIDVIATRQDTIQSTAQQKVVSIKQSYKELPVTIENAQKESVEISAVRIDSLWTGYCAALPTDKECTLSTSIN